MWQTVESYLELPERARAFGLRWFHLPIVDVWVPDLMFEEEWERAGCRSFDSDGLNETRRSDFHSGNKEGRILGDDTFAVQVFAEADQLWSRGYTLPEVLTSVCRAYGITEED